MRRAALLAALLLGACDPLANPGGTIKVSVITADNGVPCVLASGNGAGGLAISCDWTPHQTGSAPR